MSNPFRDDSVGREERAAQLEAERMELEARRVAVETRIVELRRARFAPLFGKLWSAVGLSLVLVALAGGYVVGRWVMTNHHECR